MTDVTDREIEPARGETCCKELFDRRCESDGPVCGRPASVVLVMDGERMPFCERHYRP